MASSSTSARERDFVILTSFADPKATIVAQPMTIPFEDDGIRRRYTPDFSIRWSDGRFALAEVKYRADLRPNRSSYGLASRSRVTLRERMAGASES